MKYLAYDDNLFSKVSKTNLFVARPKGETISLWAILLTHSLWGGANNPHPIKLWILMLKVVSNDTHSML